MFRIPPRFSAATLALAAPLLVAGGGLVASAPLSGVSAQDGGLDAGQSEGRRGRSRRGRERAERKPKLPPGMQQASPIATFGDWNVFTAGEGRAKVCYAIAQPQTRTPKTLARDTGYLFVTVRKAENVQNEIAVMFGFKPKPAASQGTPGAKASPSDPYLSVGNARYGLVVKDENAWVQNQAEEGKIVAEMAKTQLATVKTTSGRGSTTSDDYALGGFSEAVKRAREECK